ncbi:hypothetical protein ABK040_005406 [Willaertia magna]
MSIYYKPLEIKALAPKKTDALDFIKPLTKFIKTQYGEHVIRDYEAPITALQQRRNELRNLQEKSEGSRDLCIRYAIDMAFVANHFPIDQGVARINLSFSWYDSFNRGRVSQGNSNFEIANVLFNAAILEHQLGCSENRNSEEGTINAAKHFQIAAGLFQYIKERVTPNIVEKITSDLTNEVLDTLVLLCLANAQQCICEKAAKKGMKANILSKLYYGCGVSYKLVADQISNSKTVGNCFDKNWRGYAKFCEHYFEALASYHIAVNLHEEMQIGKEITRIIYAQNALVDAGEYRVTPLMKLAMDELNQALDKMYQTAQHENSKIYHDRVPELKDLEVLEAKQMAKSSEIKDLNEFLKEKVADPFFNLFPIPVMEAKQRYDESAKKRVQDVFRAAREHRERLQNDLARMGLPGSIMAAEQKTGFPDDVHHKISKVVQDGGINRIFELKQTLDEMAEETKQMLDKVTVKLDEEQKEDDDCRIQYGQRWPRLESSKLTMNLRKQIQDYLSKLRIAQNSDKLIEKKITENAEGFKWFALDKKSLDDKMPQSLATINNQSSFSKSINDLKLYVAQLDDLMEQESQLEIKMTNELRSYDKENEQKLLQSQSNLDGMVQQLLLELESRLKLITQELPQKEDQYMQSIVEANKVFEQHKSQNNITQQREHILQFVYNAINKYHEICSNIQEGINFYTTMQDIAKKLLRRVEDFVFARKTEKQDIITNIQQQISGVTIDPQYNFYANQYQHQQPIPQYQQPQNYYNPNLNQQQQQYYNPQQYQNNPYQQQRR